MVVLDEDAVSQVHPVVVAAADAHGVLVQGTQAGAVLRVSMMRASVPSTALTYSAVWVAMPLIRCRMFSANRSPSQYDVGG